METCNGFFHAIEKNVPSCVDAFQSSGVLQWVFGNIFEGFYNLFYAILNPMIWLSWLGELGKLTSVDAKQALMRFVYYGGSVEFFFVVFNIFLILTIIGMFRRQFMWGMVRGFEGVANVIGRIFAWAALAMVLQQIIIVFMQRIFTAAQIKVPILHYFSDFFTRDVSWWAEELKLYNAMLVALCVSYTFVQGGHVRVDLVYSAVGHRAKRMIDMFGSLFFILPVAVVTWMYGWFFLWRHLIVPNPSATDALDRLLTKARAARWNVETIGFSPNGFDAYFLFKILLVAYAGLIFLQGVTFFFRSFLEWSEGAQSAGKYLDRDTMVNDDGVEREIHYDHSNSWMILPFAPLFYFASWVLKKMFRLDRGDS